MPELVKPQARMRPALLDEVFNVPRDDSGLLVSVVGFDGSGKTTQIERLAERFRISGREVVETRQPTDWYRQLGEVRQFHNEGGPTDEATILSLLAAADRRRNVSEVINPALQRGAIVICDRYVYASFGVFVHRGVPAEFVATLNQGIPEPDFPFYLDLDSSSLVDRLRRRDGDDLQFEERSIERIESITRTYREMGDRLIGVDGTAPLDEVTDALWEHMSASGKLG